MGDMLAGLAGPAEPLHFRQGTILTWNPVTLEHSIRIGGEGGPIFANLQVLGVAEAASIQAGSVVGILVAGNTWAILGRLVAPNSEEAQDAITLLGRRRQTDDVLTQESTTSAVFVDLTTLGPYVDVIIPASGKVQVTISANCGGPANSVGVDITGAYIEAPSTQKSLAIAAAGLIASSVILYEGLPAGQPCTFKLMYRSNGVDPADFSNRTIIVEAL